MTLSLLIILNHSVRDPVFGGKANPGTPEGDRLDILATLVQAFEAKHVPITTPDPVEAIKFRMDQSGLSIKDLEPIIGKSNRVYEVLNRKRQLTLAMIRRLHKSLGIPADVLIAETAATSVTTKPTSSSSSTAARRI